MTIKIVICTQLHLLTLLTFGGMILVYKFIDIPCACAERRSLRWGEHSSFLSLISMQEK